MMPNAPRSGRPGSDYRTVAELLDTYRRRDPGKVAVVDVGRDISITFGELAAVVDGIALQLADLGVHQGSRVVLLADSGIEKLVIWLASWRVGAVICPLDLSFIRTSASAILKAIGPDLVLSDGRQPDLDALRDLTVPVVRFVEWGADAGGVRDDHDQITFRMNAPEGECAAHLPSPALTDWACLTCTSGTTGIPKIVAYDHLAYWENGLDSIDLLDLQAHDRTLEYRPLDWYSAQILSLMPFLQLGLTLHLAPKFSYHCLPEWIERYRITVCVGVPAVINILLNTPVPHARRRFASLRIMTCSTAPLSSEHWRRFEQTYGIRLANLYGSSETGWICGNRPSSHRMGTVGQPVTRLQLNLLSESGDAAPRGTPGQVVVSADKLAVGYLQADGSIQSLRGKPYILADIAVMDQDGFVQVLGRTDELIIRGGVKISPVEIEVVLMAHPAVLDAAVVGIPDPVYGQQPVCFVVLQPSHTIEENHLLAHCRAHLPREKVPVNATLVAALPRSPRGKLLRAKLRELYRDAETDKGEAPG